MIATIVTLAVAARHCPVRAEGGAQSHRRALVRARPSVGDQHGVQRASIGGLLFAPLWAALIAHAGLEAAGAMVAFARSSKLGCPKVADRNLFDPQTVVRL
jgi:hypothetical protein